MRYENHSTVLALAPVTRIFLAHPDPMQAYDDLLAATPLPGGVLCPPNFLITALAAFERAYRDMLGVDFLYIVRTLKQDPLLELRDAARDEGVGQVQQWPADDQIRESLLTLLVTGFAYDFPLARRYCHSTADRHKRQTRLAGWGAAYFEERLAAQWPFTELHSFAEARFREWLQPVAAHVVRESKLVDRRRLSESVAWVAP
jgi:hypothetical protein